MKKKYTIVTVISMLIGVADFIFLGCVSDEFFSENAAFVIFIFLAVLLLLIAILKTTEKKYYNDAECWKPEKIKLPELNGALFEDFFKQQLIKNGFTEFSEYNDNPEKAGVQVFYLKEKKNVLCIALIDAKLFSKVSRNGLFVEIIDQLYNRNIIKKSIFFPGGRFLPIIYCEKKNNSLKNLLKQAYFQYSGFNVFPCVASLDEGLIYVTTLMVNYYRGQRMQSKNKEAPAIIYSILNNQDNVK